MNEKLTAYASVYLAMVKHLRYRPMDLNDARIQDAIQQGVSRLQAESQAYARRFKEEEDEGMFQIGVADPQHARAFVMVVEGARLLAANEPGKATELLEMAIRSIGK